ncbi:HAT dimerization [Mycena venus]|uniref:HAT dimerization n=1 Tax=Mycena venus TaxID=2733690 RepID=A0A8H7CE97_9AGAR|nr:HAT dimerization [Mycena venus]
MKALEEVFNKYYATGKDENEVEVISVASSVNPPLLQQYGSSFPMDAVNSVQQAERARADPLDELKGYLPSPLEVTDNVLHWWGHNTSRPTLRRIARDYLAIQGSATPAERAFSSGSLTGAKLRNSLTADIFEALQLLKSAYRNGHISAAALAAKHIDALIAELDENVGYDAEDEDSPTED